MSRNREPVKSLEESESDSGEEESGSESESEAEATQTQKAVKTAPPPNLPPSSSSESNSDASETMAASKKAISSKAEAVTPTSKKRPAGDISGPSNSKKSKAATAEPEKKAVLFQRFWSEDDEIAILSGLIEFSRKKKLDPTSNLSAFHDFIKKNLDTEFTRAQLQDKIRRLKKKFVNIRSKEEKDGKQRFFSKTNEQKAYDLSREIWGNEVRVNVADAEIEVKKAGVAGDVGENLNTNSLANEVAKVLDGHKEWRALRVKELQVFLSELYLMAEQTKSIISVIEGRFS